MIRSEDEAFLREAIRLSYEKMADGEGGPFGALVVRDGQILGRGWNRVTSDLDPTAHAEIVAIREACAAQSTFHLTGATIYTSCEPCPMCLCAILWARLQRIVYGASRHDAAAAGFDDEKFYKEINREIADRMLPAEQMLRDEAQQVLKSWLKNPNRREY